MVVESTEFKFRAQIASLLLASIPVYGILIAVVYFFLLDWRHLQLFGKLNFISSTESLLAVNKIFDLIDPFHGSNESLDKQNFVDSRLNELCPNDVRPNVV